MQSLGVLVPSSYSPRSGIMIDNVPSVATTFYNMDDSDSDDGTVARELENYVINTRPDDPVLGQITDILNECASRQETQWTMPTRPTYSVPSSFNQMVQN